MSQNSKLDVVVIGGGQSALTVAYFLKRTGMSYVLLDAESAPGGAWRHGWDSLRLFSPSAWSSIAGWPMPAVTEETPHRDDVIDYLTQYERRYGFPIIRSTRVTHVENIEGGLRVFSGDGHWDAKVVRNSGVHGRTTCCRARDRDAFPYGSDYFRRWKWDHDHRQRNCPTYTARQLRLGYAPWTDRSPSVGCTSRSAHGMRIHPGAAWPKQADLDHGRDIGRQCFGRIHQTTSIHPSTGLNSSWGKRRGSKGGVAWHSPSRQ